MKGTEMVLKALADNGVNYVFGYTGGAIMPIFDEMEKQKIFKFIMSRHEQGAAFMAQGLSRASLSTKAPQIGVCMATSGPGAMNLVTGVADAGMDSVPMLAVTGQVPTGVIATDAFQESDVVGVMMPLTKQTYMPLSIDDIESTIHEAMFVTANGRSGPVVVDIPKDVQIQEAESVCEIDPNACRPRVPGYAIQPSPDLKELKRAVNLINDSERPIILCGHGVITSNSGQKLQEFAQRTHMPVAFTLHGLSAMPVDHHISLGMVGMHGTVEANRALLHADLIVALGMRFDDRVTGNLDQFAKDAKVIHVEIDPSEIEKNVKTTVALHADVGQVLNMLVNDPTVVSRPRNSWFARIEEFRNEIAGPLKSEIDAGVGREGQLLAKSVVSQLSRITAGKDLIVGDVGQHQMILARFYNFQTFNSWFTSGGAGTMGCSLPMAIGVKLARPSERVWSVSGDGGFQMNIQELGTIMEHNIDIKIILMNNGYLGMVRQWQTLFYDGRYAGTPMINPDYGNIANAYGIPYMKISELEEVEKGIRKAVDHPGPFMLEFLCDPGEIVLPMVPAGGSIGDMIVSVEKE